MDAPNSNLNYSNPCPNATASLNPSFLNLSSSFGRFDELEELNLCVNVEQDSQQIDTVDEISNYLV